MNNTLKWIFLLPTSFLFGFLWTFPLHWILYGTLVNGSVVTGIDIVPIETFLTPIVVVTTMILTAYKLAPDHKFKASLGVFTFWILFVISAVLFTDDRSFDFRTLSTFIFACLALRINWNKDKKENISHIEDSKNIHTTSILNKVPPETLYIIMSLIIAVGLIFMVNYLV